MVKHNLSIGVALAIVVVTLASCSNHQRDGSGATYTDDIGQEFCSVHREPLFERDGFWTGDPVPTIQPSEKYLKVADKFPNHIGQTESLGWSEFTPVPRKIKYCRSCEDGLEKALDE